jgi:hypothetical protein
MDINNHKMILTLVIFISFPLLNAADDVTPQTRANPQALAALEAPGTVFYTEDFEDGDFNGWFDAWGPPIVVNDQAQAHTVSNTGSTPGTTRPISAGM